jgi:hypothetical protein
MYYVMCNNSILFNSHYPRVEYYTFSTIMKRNWLISFIIRQTATDVLIITLYTWYNLIALKFAIGLHKLVGMIFAVLKLHIIKQAVGNESCYPMKNTLIITALSSRSRKNCFSVLLKFRQSTIH